MSDKLDKWIVVAGSLALAIVLGLGIFADIGAYANDGWRRDDPHPVTLITTLLFGQNRH
jgi:hypothetical protein